MYQDYYIYVQVDNDHYERHAGLTEEEAAKLREVLAEEKEKTGGSPLIEFTVDLEEPEWYTVGYEDTIWAIRGEVLGYE